MQIAIADSVSDRLQSSSILHRSFAPSQKRARLLFKRYRLDESGYTLTAYLLRLLGPRGALYVLNSKSGTVVIPKIELCEIPMQMLFADMVERTDYAALENRKIIFSV